MREYQNSVLVTQIEQSTFTELNKVVYIYIIHGYFNLNLSSIA